MEGAGRASQNGPMVFEWMGIGKWQICCWWDFCYKEFYEEIIGMRIEVPKISHD